MFVGSSKVGWRRKKFDKGGQKDKATVDSLDVYIPLAAGHQYEGMEVKNKVTKASNKGRHVT